MDIARIENAIDKAAAGATSIDMALGGVRFQSMIELMEFAKMMAVSDLAVPYHLRGNPGACLAVCTKALRFGFDPFSLAEHSYRMVKKEKQGDRWVEIETIAYDSFVIRAIINAHAPIEGRIKYGYDGEGDGRTCTATVVDRATGEVISHTSPTLGELKAMRGRNESGKIKGSPLWDSPKSDVQHSYDTGRDLCRINYPEILLGVYDKDELEEYGPHTARDVTPAKPSIGERLKGQDGKRGFSADHVERETAGAQAQKSLSAPSEQPMQIEADAPKPEPEKVEAKTEPTAAQQANPLPAGDPGEIPEALKRDKDNKPKAAKKKAEPEPEKPPVIETVDEEGIVKTLTDTLHNAKQSSLQGKDDGVALQTWQKSAAVQALRAKLSPENNSKIGAAVREAWDAIT